MAGDTPVKTADTLPIPLPTHAAMYERRIGTVPAVGGGPSYAGQPIGLLLALTRAS